MSVVLTRQSTVYRRLSQAKRVAALPYGLRRGLSFLGLVFLGVVTIKGVYGIALGILAYVYSVSYAARNRMPEARSIMLGGLIGILIDSRSLFPLLYWIALWIVLEIFVLKVKPKYKNIKVMTVMASILYPVLIIIGKKLAFPLVTYALYGTLCAVLLANNYKSLVILQERDRVWDNEEVISLIMSSVIFGSSVCVIEVFGLCVGQIVMWLLVAASGMLGGPLWGVVAAALVSFSGSLLEYSHCLIMLGAFTGVISMMKGYAAVLIALTFVLIVMNRNLSAVGPEIIVAEICLPFLLRKMQPLKFSVPSFVPPENTESKALELKARIEKFSETLEELSKVFQGIPIEKAEEGDKTISSLIEAIVAKVCRSCIQRGSCWERDFYTTYANMFDLLVESEESPSGESICEKARRWCSQPKEITDSTLSLLKMRGLDIVWQKRLIESKGVVANQLKGLASVVNNLSNQLELLEKDKHCAEVSSFELKRKGIKFDSIECCRFEHGVTVAISVMKQDGNCLDKEVRGIISRVTGQDCIIERHVCKDGFCELYLVPRYMYDVNVYIRRKPAAGYAICGDSCEEVSLKKGRHLAVLSDGMGVGPEAAIQSSTVVSFIEKFISLDVPSTETLKLVNSVSYLSCEEDTFATVDLVLIDKYTGEVRMSKLGSAQSHVKRGRRVEAITSNSVPVGMLSSIKIVEKHCQFRPKDILVVVSDGVINEGAKRYEDPRWLEKLLINVDGSADEIGDEIFSKLPMDNRDDLTVMVLELKLI